MTTFDTAHNRLGTKSIKWNRFKIENALPMWVADTDFKAPAPVLEALSEAMDHGIFGYSECDESVNQSVVNWMKNRHDWEIDSSQLIYCNGVVSSISAIINALTEENDAIVIQTPVYPPFSDLVKRNNRKLVDNPLNFANGNYSIDFTGLEKIFQTESVKMLIFCSPHNPVGRVWSRDELEQLANLCLQYNVIILSDEIHHDIVFAPHKHTPIASLSKEIEMQTVTCAAPSKTFNLAGLQSSVIIAKNNEIKNAISEQLLKQGFHGINYLGTVALEAAYTHGAEWLDEQNDYFKENIELVRNYFAENFPEVTWVEPEGTYLIWINVSSLVKNNENVKEALEKEVQLIVEDGEKYGAPKNEFIRMNIGCPRSYVLEALERINKFTSSVKTV